MRNQIITELFQSDDFNKCIRKMEPVDLQEDLKAEVMIVMCELDEDKLIAMHQRGELKFYAVRVILNMVQSNTSAFYKKYRSFKMEDISKSYTTGFFDASEFEHFVEYQEPGRKCLESLALDKINTLNWYEKGLIELYLRFGNYRAIEKETGIPFESVGNTIRSACRKIKMQINESL